MEDGTMHLQLAAQLWRIGQIAIMHKGKLALDMAHNQRLGIGLIHRTKG